MKVKFCLFINSPFIEDACNDVITARISEELNGYDCGLCDVAELGDVECWVFQLNAAGMIASEITDWVHLILTTLERHTRRLQDTEWTVVLDRLSLYQRMRVPSDPFSAG